MHSYYVLTVGGAGHYFHRVAPIQKHHLKGKDKEPDCSGEHSRYPQPYLLIRECIALFVTTLNGHKAGPLFLF